MQSIHKVMKANKLDFSFIIDDVNVIPSSIPESEFSTTL